VATHDYSLANQDGASFRSDLNNALAAIVSNNSSSTSPATTFAHQIWVDTTANVIKQRNAANDAWIELWRIDGGFNAKTFSSNVTLNAQSDLRFADSDSSNWVAFQAPATVASNVTWTLPSADGTADQALTTNGSGVLSWADAGGVQDNITEGNTSAEVVDTGSDGHFKVVTEGTERFRVANDAVYTFTGGNSASDPGEIILSGRNSSDLTRPAGKFLIGPNGTDSWTGEFTLQLRNDAGTFTDRFHVSGKTGNVGIGNTTPDGSLHVHSGSAGTVSAAASANDLVIENNGPVGVSLLFDDAATNAYGNIYWGNETDGNADGRITYFGSTYTTAGDRQSMVFRTAGTERARLDSSGNLKFNSGYGSAATAYGCRAWARFEQIGTQSVVGSGGISTISDLGTGMTQLNFSFTMPDTNYAVVSIGSPTWAAHTLIADDLASYQTTTSCRIECRNVSFTLVDSGNPQIAIFR